MMRHCFLHPRLPGLSAPSFAWCVFFSKNVLGSLSFAACFQANIRTRHPLNKSANHVQPSCLGSGPTTSPDLSRRFVVEVFHTRLRLQNESSNCDLSDLCHETHAGKTQKTHLKRKMLARMHTRTPQCAESSAAGAQKRDVSPHCSRHVPRPAAPGWRR